MAQELDAVTLTAPTSDPVINEGQTFTLSATYTQVGHGGEEVVSLNWEFSTSSGGPYSAISGGLSVITNPTTGSDSAITHSVTVTGETEGTYFVHIRAVGNSSGFVRESGDQEITINAGASTTPKTITGSITQTGSLSTQTSKVLSASITQSGQGSKQITKNAEGSATISGALQALKTILFLIVGSLSPSGMVSRVFSAGQFNSGSLSTAGSIRKQARSNTEGYITSTGAITRAVRFVLVGSVVMQGKNAKRAERIIEWVKEQHY